jgi:hypothetical protein
VFVQGLLPRNRPGSAAATQKAVGVEAPDRCLGMQRRSGFGFATACHCCIMVLPGVLPGLSVHSVPLTVHSGGTVESHSGAEGCSCKATLPSMFSGIDVTYQPCRKALCCVVPLSPNVQRGVSMMISTSSQR